MIQLHSTIKRNNEDFLCSKLGAELVMMNLKTGDYLGLNEVSSDIWDLLKEPRTAEEVVNGLLQQYEVTKEDCEQQTLECLNKMAEQGMVSAVEVPVG